MVGREGGEAHNNSNISIVGHKGQQLPPREQGAVGHTERARLQWGNNWAIYILKRRRRKRGRKEWREAGTNDHLQSYGNTSRVLKVGNGVEHCIVRHRRRSRGSI